MTATNRVAVAVATVTRYLRNPPITQRDRDEAAEAVRLLQGFAEVDRARLERLAQVNANRQVTEATRRAVNTAWTDYRAKFGRAARRKIADPLIAAQFGIPLHRVRNILRTNGRPSSDSAPTSKSSEV